jgi:diaminohydroxyphosphoribosylaminopyrimidine deaminase/5-amino-6-(5-phosphoribosylamino)uracil reductase
VINEQIVAEGWHTGFGNPHAEVEVLNQVSNLASLKDSYKILYVSLEPCCHQGKTPPCTNLIIKSGIDEVHIGAVDQNPLVAGRGIKMLKEAGIKVFLHNHSFSENLNRSFNTILKYNRPYIVLKWAQSADGFIGRAGEKIWLSNQGSNTFVHQLRNKVDAIMVGNNTLRNDKPALSARIHPFKDPKKIVLDLSGSLDYTWLYEWLGEGDFYFASEKASSNLFSTKENVNQIQLATNGTEYSLEIWQELMTNLYHANVGSVLIEGGAKVLQFLIRHQLWDELILIKTPVTLKSGIKAPSIQLIPSSTKQILDNQIEHYFNPTLHTGERLQSSYFQD